MLLWYIPYKSNLVHLNYVAINILHNKNLAFHTYLLALDYYSACKNLSIDIKT